MASEREILAKRIEDKLAEELYRRYVNEGKFNNSKNGLAELQRFIFNVLNKHLHLNCNVIVRTETCNTQAASVYIEGWLDVPCVDVIPPWLENDEKDPDDAP